MVALGLESVWNVMALPDAQLKAFAAYSEMTEAAWRLPVVMPTEPNALEKNFSVLPPEIACRAGNGQSLAFDLLRTVRLSLRAIFEGRQTRTDVMKRRRRSDRTRNRRRLAAHAGRLRR